MKTFRLHILSTLILAFIATGATKAAAQQTVWVVCTIDTSSIYKKDGREKFERRLYVTDLISMTRKEFLKIDGSDGRIEGSCADYFNKTIGKAAEERGEKLDPGARLTVIRNIEMSGNNLGQGDFYKFAPKEDIIKKRDEAIKEMKDADRIIVPFIWEFKDPK